MARETRHTQSRGIAARRAARRAACNPLMAASMSFGRAFATLPVLLAPPALLCIHGSAAGAPASGGAPARARAR